jgi:transposase
VQHSEPVRAWLAQRTEQIELFYLPSYSPELNPEERFNSELKQAMGSKVPARTKANLRAAASEHIQALEQSPERVKKYFRDPRVKYAA